MKAEHTGALWLRREGDAEEVEGALLQWGLTCLLAGRS
jgi:hypothetical protein